MDKVHLRISELIYDNELLGITKQTVCIHKFTLKFALEFGKWIDSLTEEEIGNDTMEELLKFFKDDVF